VVQDLDHLSYSMGLYRHLTHFAGGQGIVIVVLSLFAAGGGIGTLYVAEGREERILPNVVRTSRFIFQVAGVYLVVGTVALFAALWAAGLGGWRGASGTPSTCSSPRSTPGASRPTSQSIAYYHSAAVEGVIVVLMVAGTMSFGLHYQLWLGATGGAGPQPRGPQPRDDDLLVATAVAMVGLAARRHLHGPRRAVPQGVLHRALRPLRDRFRGHERARSSADWGALAPAAIVIAMALGGMAGSTAGGIKAIRVGLTAKGARARVRRVLLPEAALPGLDLPQHADRILRGPALRAASAVLLLYVVTYLAGSARGLAYGRWDVTETLFESVSAAANVGLSVGIVEPGCPSGLQVTYILQMWLGRLEFLAAFALIGYLLSLVRFRHRQA
jgi:trk system potassium uptake protein